MFTFSMSFAVYFLFRIKLRLNMSVKLKFGAVNELLTTDLPDHLSIDKQTTEKVCEFWFYLKEIKFKFSDQRTTLNYKTIHFVSKVQETLVFRKSKGQTTLSFSCTLFVPS